MNEEQLNQSGYFSEPSDEYKIQIMGDQLRSLYETLELIQFRIDETIKEDNQGTWASNKEMFKCLMDIKCLIK